MHPTRARFSYAAENETPWARYERMKRDIAAYAESPREYEQLITALAAEVMP